MIAIIRIRGQVNIRRDILETLNRLGLKKKYTCVVIEKPNAVELGMIEKIKDFVAYGELDSETHKKLIEARGKFSKSKIHFRLHPPRGGIDSKKHFGIGKGVLGNNKNEINKLVNRML
jgi:large subunit ribosomal protein L30